MTEISDAIAAVTALVSRFGQTRDQVADLLSGPSDGGPDGNGYYPVTLADGTSTILVPSPRKVAALASAGAKLAESWAALSGAPGAQGDGATVLDSDAGIHTDPVTGANVPNAGLYSYQAGAPAGWKWIGNTVVADAGAARDAAAASAATAANTLAATIAALPTAVSTGARLTSLASNDKRVNLARNAQIGFLDENGNVQSGNTGFRTYTFSIDPRIGKFTSSIAFPSNSRMMFFNGDGSVAGSMFGTGSPANGGTIGRTVYDFSTIAPTAVFCRACVNLLFVDPTFAGFANYDATFWPSLVIADGDVQLMDWHYYEPALARDRNRWIGKRIFWIGDSYPTRSGWAYRVARTLGLQSMVRSWLGGHDVTSAMLRPINALRNDNVAGQPDSTALDWTRNTANLGDTIVPTTAADLEGCHAVFLARHRNGFVNNRLLQVGTIKDQPATFDPVTGVMTNAGAGTYAAQVKGVIERYFALFKTLAQPKVTLILGTGIPYGADLGADGLDKVLEQTDLIKNGLSQLYGCPVADVAKRCGINAVNQDLYMQDGVHLTYDAYDTTYAQAHVDEFLNIAPLS